MSAVKFQPAASQTFLKTKIKQHKRKCSDNFVSKENNLSGKLFEFLNILYIFLIGNFFLFSSLGHHFETRQRVKLINELGWDLKMPYSHIQSHLNRFVNTSVSASQSVVLFKNVIHCRISKCYISAIFKDWNKT